MLDASSSPSTLRRQVKRLSGIFFQLRHPDARRPQSGGGAGA
jgi:hypothetical protein